MFDIIEKKYLKDDPDRRFNKTYGRASAITFIVFILLAPLIKNNIIIFLGSFIIMLFFSIIYFVIDFKKIVSKKESKESIIKKIQMYFAHIDKIKMDNLLIILRKENVNTLKKIELLISHYEKKLPLKSHTNFFDTIIQIIIGLSAFIIAFLDNDTNKINYEAMGIVIGDISSILVIIFSIWICYKFVTEILIANKNDLYENLVNQLTYIYIHFDSYKSNLKIK